MDIYEFINSRDISKYLKEVGYEFTPVEMAWLIYQSKKKTKEEKIEAYKELIITTDDMNIEGNSEVLLINESLHNYLERYISYLEGTKKKKKEMESNGFEEELFDWLWFNFPVPFKRGDILCKLDEQSGDKYGLCKGVMVMTGITPQEYEHTKRKGHDSSDMNVWGYFQNEDGQIYQETNYNYMDYEYYRGECKGVKRILTALSNYEKGEIGAELLMHSYHVVMMEEYAKRIKPNWFTEEGMKLAGLV